VAIGPVTAPTTATGAAPTRPTPRTTTAATPAVKAPTDPSAPLLAELGRGKTVVLLFAGSTASDDRAVRRALARINRHGGKVTVHIAPVGRVGDFEAITRGVQVQQSPTLLVMGRQHTARTIVGFTTTDEIDQLVADVRRG
jgi:xanthine/CO dehydrogenase XdhC/CoxF family maturation factor